MSLSLSVALGSLAVLIAALVVPDPLELWQLGFMLGPWAAMNFWTDCLLEEIKREQDH